MHKKIPDKMSSYTRALKTAILYSIQAGAWSPVPGSFHCLFYQDKNMIRQFIFINGERQIND